jgi:hypothetical protein
MIDRRFITLRKYAHRCTLELEPAFFQHLGEGEELRMIMQVAEIFGYRGVDVKFLHLHFVFSVDV